MLGPDTCTHVAEARAADRPKPMRGKDTSIAGPRGGNEAAMYSYELTLLVLRRLFSMPTDYSCQLQYSLWRNRIVSGDWQSRSYSQ